MGLMEDKLCMFQLALHSRLKEDQYWGFIYLRSEKCGYWGYCEHWGVPTFFVVMPNQSIFSTASWSVVRLAYQIGVLGGRCCCGVGNGVRSKGIEVTNVVWLVTECLSLTLVILFNKMCHVHLLTGCALLPAHSWPRYAVYLLNKFI